MLTGTIDLACGMLQIARSFRYRIRSRTSFKGLRIKAKRYKRAVVFGAGSSVSLLNREELELLTRDAYLVGYSYASLLDINYDEYYIEFENKHQGYLREVVKKDLYDICMKRLEQGWYSRVFHKYAGGSDFFEENGTLKRRIYAFFLRSANKHCLRLIISTFPYLFRLGSGWQVCGTLSLILFRLYSSGFKEIVLTGIDLDDNGYFWSKSNWTGYRPEDQYTIVDRVEKTETTMHKTNDANFHRYTMSELIADLSKTIKVTRLRLAVNQGALAGTLDHVFKRK